jgi:two-component system, NarL family, sensor kinase
MICKTFSQFLLGILGILICSNLYSQTGIDTLETKHILKEKTLQKQGERYEWYALLNLFKDANKAIKYNTKAEVIFIQTNHFEGIANCIKTKANIAMLQNEPIKSYEIFQQAILYCDKYKNQKWAQKTKYMIYGDLANVTNFYGDYNTSLKYLLDSYEYFKNIDPGISYNGCVMISDLYITLGKYEEALKFAQLSLNHGKKLVNGDFNHPYWGLVSANYNRIKSLILLNRNNEAEVELKLLKKTIDTIGHEPYYIFFYELSSSIENNKKNYELAINNTDKVIALYLKAGNKIDLEATKFNKGEILMKLKKYNQAKQIFLKLLKNQNGALKVDTYLNLSIIEKSSLSYKEAYTYLEKSKNLKDSLDVVENTNKAIFWNIKYESEKKQKQIIDLEKQKAQKDIALQKQNSLIYSLIAGFLVIALIGFVGYRNINYRRKLAENEIITLQKEKQLTATESIIQGQEEERSRLARDLHDGLGGLLSGIKLTLNNMTGNVILSEQNANSFTRALGQLDNAIAEMRRVAHSMMPEALLKFGLKDALNDFCEGISHAGKIKVHFQSYNFEKRLDQTVEVTIYRIIQELLNNTLKHAEATEVFVQLNQDDQHLTISVEDNGKGFDIHKLNEAKGIGIQNVENRVAYLNGKIDIQSSEGKGTLTLIEIENT